MKDCKKPRQSINKAIKRTQTIYFAPRCLKTVVRHYSTYNIML